MTTAQRLAKQLRGLYFGGSWTDTHFQKLLENVNWKQATEKYKDLNTIVKLVYHTNYYIEAQLSVLKENTLEASDKFSFDHPPINSEEDWQKLLSKCFQNAEEHALLIEQMNDEALYKDFWGDKYGSFYDNFVGLIEHNHYHLGQISLLKKLMRIE